MQTIIVLVNGDVFMEYALREYATQEQLDVLRKIIYDRVETSHKCFHPPIRIQFGEILTSDLSKIADLVIDNLEDY